MTQDRSEDGWLTGQLLIAMPSMSDPRFERTVVYMCAHSEEGAMGLVINKSLESLSFTDLLEQLGVEDSEADMSILSGGPVETGRGFVLHSADYDREGSLAVSDNIRLTATIDVLKAIAVGHGPQKRLLALGYAGWAAGQIEGEIQDNGWLNRPRPTTPSCSTTRSSPSGRAPSPSSAWTPPCCPPSPAAPDAAPVKG